MKTWLIPIFIVMALLLGSLSLSANLHWHIIFDSISHEQIEMRLYAYYYGSEPLTLEFPCTPWYHFSIDGQIPAITTLPMVSQFTFEPQGQYFFPMAYVAADNWPLEDGFHLVQGMVMDENAQWVPVGATVQFHLPIDSMDAINWDFMFDEISQAGISMRLKLENPNNHSFTHTFPTNPIYSYSFDGNMVSLNPVLSPFTVQVISTEPLIFPRIFHPGPIALGEHIIQIYVNGDDGLPLMAVGDAITLPVVDLHSITIGAGDERARIPLDFYWRNSLYQCLWTPAEMERTGGRIKAVSFFSDFESFDSNMNWPVRIAMGNTTQQDLQDGWVNPDHIQLVYDGYMVFPNGAGNEVTFWLDAPFDYDGSSNLAVIVERIWTLYFYISTEKFLAQSCEPGMARKAWSDAIHYDLMTPPEPTAGQLIAQRPMTKFTFDANTVPASDPAWLPPLQPILARSYPNPINKQIHLEIEQAKAGVLSLGIYNLRGQKVKTIPSSNLGPGTHTLSFAPVNDQGIPLPNGIYIIKIKQDSHIKTLKISLVR